MFVRMPVVIAAAILLSVALTSSAAEPPNIVLVLADDLGYGDQLSGTTSATIGETKDLAEWEPQRLAD